MTGVQHIHAVLNPQASGRYLIAAGDSTRGLFDMVDAIRDKYKGRRFPVAAPPRWLLWLLCKVTRLYPWDLVVCSLNKRVGLDGSRAVRELGIKYMDPVDGLCEMCDRVLELGLVK